jgi:UDP-GlcNAc:undecaprenyl-phosphate/decaprenyl-phosphate GlcNAc-1-phosphate transferase
MAGLLSVVDTVPAMLLLPPGLAALLSFVFTPLACHFASWVGAVDRPGPRRVHTVPVPRLGGLAIVAAIYGVIALLAAADVSRIVGHVTGSLEAGITFGVIPVLIVSIVDDIRPLPAGVKALGHLAGAFTAGAFGIQLNSEVNLLGRAVEIGWLSIPISLLWIVGLTNAFNIVDGLDGLSAGLALISALSLGLTSLVVGQTGLAILALILAGALVGFLPYNIYPAKVFLGDTGSAAIGFFLACLALRGGSTLTSGLAVVTPILVLGLPIAETLVSMSRRMLRGLRSGAPLHVFSPDAGHFHHRLLALGFDQRRAVLVLYGAGLLAALVGFASVFLSHKKAAVLLLTMLAAAFVGLWRLGYDEFAFLRRGDFLRLYEVPVLRRGLFIVFADLIIVIVSIYCAFVLKYDDWRLVHSRGSALWLLTVLAPLSFLSFSAFGLYRRAWRLASAEDMLVVTIAVSFAAASGAVLSQLFNPTTPPATWFVICYVVKLLGMTGSRASHRLLLDMRRRALVDGDPVLIYGAGRGGALVVREVVANPEVGMRPLGFIDDDPALRGKTFAGYPLLGGCEALEDVISQR